MKVALTSLPVVRFTSFKMQNTPLNVLFHLEVFISWFENFQFFMPVPNVGCNTLVDLKICNGGTLTGIRVAN